MHGVYLVIFPLLALIFALFFAIIIDTIEHYHLKLFNKPVYVHFYFSPKKIGINHQKTLENNFVFYQQLSTQKRKYFDHRVASFIAKYKFVPKEGIEISDEMKVLVAGTAVKLTFGMRKYLIDVFDKIIIYPEAYYSTVNDAWHKGEFNPRMKAIVFSWEDFLEGIKYDNDNFNLGLHEFTHAIHFHGLKGDDISSLLFVKKFNLITQYVSHPDISSKLKESNYFRAYAYTNSFEFVAVLMEHFFESPQKFEEEFPELFSKVRKMINFGDNR